MAHQRFFSNTFELPHAVKIAKQAIISEQCVVVSLQSTGESQTLKLIKNEGQISDIFLPQKGYYKKADFV